MFNSPAFHFFFFRPVYNSKSRRIPAERTDGNILSYTQVRQDPLGLTILRHHYNSIFFCIARISVLNFLSFQIDFTGYDPICSDNAPHNLCSSCTYQTGKTQDLPFSQGKTDLFCTFRFQIFDFQKHISNFFFSVQTIIDISQIPAYHFMNQFFFRNFIHPISSHIGAIFENGNFIRNCLYFFHTVRYINDHFSLFLELTNDLKQTVNFRIGQRSGGFVKGNQFQIISAIGFHNLHHLLIGNAQILYHITRFHIQTKIVYNLLCPSICLFHVNLF